MNFLTSLAASFVIALSMYTCIPMPQLKWRQATLRFVLLWLPLIGLIVGGGLVLILKIYRYLHLNSRALVAVLLTIWPLVITGGIHLDGFADTADALGSRQEQAQKIRILQDPHAGVFAVIAVAAVLLVQAAAWFDLLAFDMTKNAAVWSIVLGQILFIPVLTRAMTAFGVSILPSAKKEGLAYTFRKPLLMTAPLFFLLAAGAALAVWFLGGLAVGLLGLGVLLITFVVWSVICLKFFGGVSGDLAGFHVILSETLLIITLSFLLRNSLCYGFF